MEVRGTQPLQVATENLQDEVSDLASAIPMMQAQGVSVQDGDFNFAARDVHIQKHYHNYREAEVDIQSALRAIRNYRKIHLDTLSKATEGTGVWLLTSDNFWIWLELDSFLKILWGTGIPGAGKTILASLVIKALEARSEAAGGTICVAYVYIRYSDIADVTIRGILEVLVKQTVERHPACMRLAKRLYARHISEDTQPTEAELLQLLEEFTGAVAATFYILDALDEAPDKLQLELIRKLSCLNVRLFITSRPLKTIEAQFPEAYSFSIVAQEHDLDLHIAQDINRSPHLQDLLERAGPSLRQEVVSTIKQKCGGMFLHASLQLEALSQCMSLRDVRQTLENFPSEIEDAYLQTWNRICDQASKQVLLAKEVLLWVLHAHGTMTIEELERAVATCTETHKFEPDRQVPAATLMALCRGLVTFEEESRLVRLVHYTAKEPLLRLLQTSFPYPHCRLGSVCVTHLEESGLHNTFLLTAAARHGHEGAARLLSGREIEFDVVTGEVLSPLVYTARHGHKDTTLVSKEGLATALREDPLLSYAHDAWAAHARASLDVAAARERIAAFVENCVTFPAFTDLDRTTTFDILGPLHIIALEDLPISLVSREHCAEPNITTKVQGATPLMFAALRGYNDLIKDLLGLPQTLINVTDSEGWSALMTASRYGQEGAVALLLEHQGTEVNTMDSKHWSALTAAARHGHEGAARLLLSRHEIEVNVVTEEGWSPLVYAARHGHEAVVRLLLVNPAIDVNSKAGREGLALIMAARWGHEGVVRLLLAHPEISINPVDEDGCSPLIEAIKSGYEGIAALLLDQEGIEVNIKSNNGWCPLLWATNFGRDVIVKLLLAYPGIDANLTNNTQMSALMAAARDGRQILVELLLAYPGIKVNLVDSKGWSALIGAARYGQEGIVMLLLAQHGIEVNLATNDGRSALVWAARCGHEGIVKLLLAYPGIEVNRQGVDGLSGLHEACRCGYDGIVTLLLAHPGIDINSLDNRLWSPLMGAARYGHDRVVKLLLAHPEVDVNLVDKNGWSALMGAARNGYTGIVALLLAYVGVQVNLITDNGWSALMLAAERGHKDIVQHLLAHPEIQVNQVNRDGASALVVAGDSGYAGIVQLLLPISKPDGILPSPLPEADAASSSIGPALRLTKFVDSDDEGPSNGHSPMAVTDNSVVVHPVPSTGNLAPLNIGGAPKEKPGFRAQLLGGPSSGIIDRSKFAVHNVLAISKPSTQVSGGAEESDEDGVD